MRPIRTARFVAGFVARFVACFVARPVARLVAVVVLGLTLIAPTAALAYDLVDFSDGFGDWQISPKNIGRSSTPGWAIVSNSGEKAARNSITGTRFTYYWKLTRTVDLSHAVEPRLEMRAHFKGHGYAWFRVMVGPEGATKLADFEVVHEETEASGAPQKTVIPLDKWAGKRITVQLRLKKPHDVIEKKIGLYVHRIGVTTALAGDDERPAPDLIAIAAFNVQIFGKTKMNKAGVPEILVKTLGRYDLVAIQEIRDATETAIAVLLAQLNAASEDAYAMALSERVGRTVSKEQVAFFYRKAKLELISTSMVADGADDHFEREPFVGHFRVVDGGFEFATMVLHTAPEDTVAELGHLAAAVDQLKADSGEADVIVMGDLNADCGYASPEELGAIALFNDPKYTSWIGDDVDTTTTFSDCAYDRMVTTGAMTDRVIAGSNGTFYFDQALAIGPELAMLVSDHYPVELLLQGN